MAIHIVLSLVYSLFTNAAARIGLHVSRRAHHHSRSSPAGRRRAARLIAAGLLCVRGTNRDACRYQSPASGLMSRSH